jgi:hypothetical protein
MLRMYRLSLLFLVYNYCTFWRHNPLVLLGLTLQTIYFLLMIPFLLQESYAHIEADFREDLRKMHPTWAKIVGGSSYDKDSGANSSDTPDTR